MINRACGTAGTCFAGHRGLDTWEKLVAFAAEEWFPSRIAYGKHKGRLIQEARKDADLRGWLDWLAKSANARNAKMGRWYLRQLEMAAAQPDRTVFAAAGIDGEIKGVAAAQAGQVGLVIYVNPELEQLRHLVAGARARLAELEASFTKEKSRVDVMQAVLFRQLREHYQQRDRLRLIVDYRRKFLDSLVRSGEEEAKQAETHYEQARAQTDRDYEETAAAVAEKKQLTAEEEAELSRLWKKLVKLYHPDRFAHEPDKTSLYAPHPGPLPIRCGEGERRLHETLQLEIIAVLESLNRLRESPDYELCQLSERKPGVLEALAAERRKLLEKESAELSQQADKLAEEIRELGEEAGARIA